MPFLRTALAVLLVFCASQALAEKRVALVIGNSAYQHVATLPNPGNDAADMAAKLGGLGFEVVIGVDLDLSGVRRVLRDFVGRLDGADLALFFYAGHGLQVDGENYLAPVDARLASHVDLDFEAVPMNLILSAMERSTRVNVVLLDACRDNPLAVNLARSMGTRSASVGRGLAKVGTGIGTLIAFATQPGNVALDGSGRNSPFTSALLKHLGEPGRDITRELIEVRRDVLAATGGKQVPWDNSSLTGEVVLKPADGSQPAAAQEPATNQAAELAYWETIKDATDRDLFDAYLQQYPDGAFASLARAKIRIIERVSAPGGVTDVPAGQLVAAVDLAAAAASTDDRALTRSIQQQLNRLGCQAGSEDGLWGSGSRKALEAFARHSKVELATLEPSSDVLERLKAEKARICPLSCARNQEAKDGRCVTIRREAKLPEPSETQGTAKIPAKNTGTRAISPPAELPKKNYANCPANADVAFRQMFTRGSGRGRTTIAATHACGRAFACHRAARGQPWDCGWR
ncbi:caspase family protein [Ensifer adhaerens]|uniref:caspase family protein n=1 Tax=Ensifer adhaerens TaxID=106592 RepID=UPI0023A99E3D|nr:caspase family protein [Ensifer adhaerens]WDZ78724.1 caspase family protein [Ensifer adhaerens]